MTDTSNQMIQDRETGKCPERIELQRRPYRQLASGEVTESVILVLLPNARRNHGEFVTWVESAKDRATYWGHYHGTDLRAALEDYETR